MPKEFVMKNYTDIGLLILRVSAGGLMMTHGVAKLMNFNSMLTQFPDPIGLGSGLSLSLAVFAEFLCALLVVLGVFTRFAAIPVAITMAVAAFIVHSADPFQRKELALLYFGIFVSLIFLGGGKYSLFRGKNIPSS